MTVEHSRKESLHHIADDTRCSICGELLAGYLFPVMHYTANLYICRKCGVHNKNGLIADIVELAATEEIRKVNILPCGLRLRRFFAMRARVLTQILIARGFIVLVV